MTGPQCSGSKRKHTPIVSEKQQGFFGAEYARRKAGKETVSDIKTKDLRSHLKESAGKKLPKVSSHNPMVSPCLVGVGEAMKDTFYKKESGRK